MLLEHVADGVEAFDRYIGEGRPAYVARQGATPAVRAMRPAPEGRTGRRMANTEP
jgi:hypothetical protein